MKITAVKFTPNTLPTREGRPILIGFVDVVFDDAIKVREIKILRSGERVIVSFPAKKAHTNCPSCLQKIEVQDRYCRNCGRSVESVTRPTSDGQRYYEMAHPINAAARERTISAILDHVIAVGGSVSRLAS